jgi:outer membrane protein assembly factor BamC
VRYVDPTIEKKEPGFFSKLFGGARLPAAQYQIGVHAQGGGSLVTVQGNQGAAVPERDAQRIIKVLADDLK